MTYVKILPFSSNNLLLK